VGAEKVVGQKQIFSHQFYPYWNIAEELRMVNKFSLSHLTFSMEVYRDKGLQTVLNYGAVKTEWC
jgi:hypothetical protein